MAVVEPTLARRARARTGAAGAMHGATRTLWMDGVNAVTADIDFEIIRQSVRRDLPFETSGWTLETAKSLSLEYSLRPRGRPRGIEPTSGGEPS
jgi:hypothetical protein